MSEIQSVEGRPLKKGLSPARRSALGALVVLALAAAVFLVGQLVQPAGIPADHDLAAIMTDGRVGLARTDGSAFVAFSGSGVPPAPVSILLAPGGDFVALRTPDAIVFVDRAGVVSWRKAVLGTSATFAWSPDGSRIAVLDSGGGVGTNAAPRASLQILSSVGALEWDVPLPDGFGVAPGYANLAWAPDGATVAFSGFTEKGLIGGLQPTTLWMAALGNQALTRVTNDADVFVYDPAWATDGTLYVARSSFQQTGIWRLDPSTGAATVVLPREVPSCDAGATCRFEGLGPLVPSPDATMLAFRDVTGDVAVLVLATGAITTLSQANTALETPYEWSSDGGSLLYLNHADAPADPAVPRILERLDVGTGTSSVVLAEVRAFDVAAGAP